MNGKAKRALDIILTAPAIFFLLPVFVLTALAIKLEGGPLLFTQDRIGKGGRRFGMLKFRTMHVDAEARLEQLLRDCPRSNEEWASYQKLKHDPRITRIGDFLRRSSLDELPQLFNILKGDMSIVGQRPILPCQRDDYGRHIAGYERARPGLTGLWQVSGRNALTFQDRAALGSEYVRNWSLWFDIKLIALTVPRVLFSKDAF
ncbi:MAG: sugar transferase [Pseudomonadota bacterium]